MSGHWLIIADDLTGAADCATAFARRRIPARVAWGEARPVDHADTFALSIDAGTRWLSPAAADARHRQLLRAFGGTRPGIYKKIDSTLRGHVAVEIAALVDVLAADNPQLHAVFAPAFPGTGRITRGAHVLVHGKPIEETEYWGHDRDPVLAYLPALLEAAGLRTHVVPLATVRGGEGALRAALSSRPRAVSIAICDAETDDDLDRIAAASALGTFHIGTAGLAQSLARRQVQAPRRAEPRRLAPSTHGALLVVGSRAAASRAALAAVRGLANVHAQSITADALRSGIDGSVVAQLGAALERGADVVVDLVPPTTGFALEPQLALQLARLLEPVATQASAIAATGGDTAAALLARVANALELVDEIEPGISLGLTLGDVAIPVATKAGGFGDAGSLQRIVERLRFIRQSGTVA